MVSKILGSPGIMGDDDLTGTAIILADEKLLMPVLSSLPTSVEDVNVTMGHPFRFTSLYSFLKQLLALIRSARVTESGTSFRSDEVISPAGDTSISGCWQETGREGHLVNNIRQYDQGE
ncbi:MAG: hypothetical protein MZV63_11725 [Marinilabiliales bacterium]|nr:hypothetical protein [Marinilabiliales bacterium]